MKKTLQTLHFLIKRYSMGIVIGFLVILSSLVISYVGFSLTDRSYPRQVVWVTPPFELIAGIFAMLIGLVLFIPDFRMALANGISRKTFFWANIPAALLFALAFSIFNLMIVLIYGHFLPISIISDLIYTHIGWVESLVLQTALYFLLVMLGRFITLIYYRSSKTVKWIVSLTPLMLIILDLQIYKSSVGESHRIIGEFVKISMGTPYRAALSMLAYSAVLCGLIFLLIRRAPLKD